jgi:glyoxylase-like metal-dependent hydrolase (beta-lactamase superfamily II)
MLNAAQPLDRRTFLADLGRGAFALAVVTTVGCGPGAQATVRASTSPNPSGTGSRAPGDGGSGSAPTASGSSAPPSAGSGGAAWERVDLGFVSAYILVRSGEAAIVDTGVSGSADAIQASLSGVGVDWSAVAHVVLTHNHGDHVGSAAEVMNRAPGATAYAGREDIASISVPRPVTPVSDGDEVFGLRVVTTPGHTPGSISVIDPVGGILVAGDAMGTADGRPILPGAQFTADMAQAKQSIVKLGKLTFETLLLGHGDPIESGASTAVAELGAAG